MAVNVNGIIHSASHPLNGGAMGSMQPHIPAPTFCAKTAPAHAIVLMLRAKSTCTAAPLSSTRWQNFDTRTSPHMVQGVVGRGGTAWGLSRCGPVIVYHTQHCTSCVIGDDEGVWTRGCREMKVYGQNQHTQEEMVACWGGLSWRCFFCIHISTCFSNFHHMLF